MPDRRTQTRRADAPRWNSLVAAAQVMTAPNQSLKVSIGRQQGWQEEAWRFYDEVGELRFAGSWIANAMSRVNLIAAAPPMGPGDEPTPVDVADVEFSPVQRRASEIVTTIAGGQAGQGQILAAMGLHLTIAGLCWLVIEPDDEDSLVHWEVFSTDEVKSTPSGEIMIRESEREWRPVHPDGIVVKVWRKHPRRSWEPDAPTHGVLATLREINLLTMHIQASAQSRLAGAGILAIPSEAVFPPGQGPQTSTGTNPDDENVTAPEDTFVDTLVEAMTVPIVDRGSAAAVVPLVVKVPGDYVDKVKHISFATPFDDRVLELMESAIKRLALGMDIPPEVLTGKGEMNHWCLPIETAAYTRTLGWVAGDSVHVGDEVLTMNPTTGRLEWDTVLDRYQATLNDEPMLRVHLHAARRGEMTVEMTSGHRNVIERDGVRMIVTADELQPGDLIPLATSRTDWATEPKFSDAFVRLLAWYAADGTLTGPVDKPGQIRIGKSWKKNPDKVRALTEILTDVFGPAVDEMQRSDRPMWRMEMQPRGMAIAVLNAAARDMILDVVPNKEKIIPTWVVDSFTAAQAELFVQAWADSDGTTSNGTWKGEIAQADPRRLDAVEYAALGLGYAVRRSIKDTGGEGRFSDRPLHLLRIGKQGYRKVRNVEQFTSSQTVWCPTTSNGTWLALDPGSGWSMVTGNSSWQVQEESITLHVEPLSEVCTHALTVGFLHAALRAEGYSEDEVRSVMVWYDTTDLRTRPDRSASAREAYDRNELSGAALLREFGLSVEDAPSPEEKREKVLLSVVRGAPTLAPALLTELGYLTEPIAPVEVGPVEVGPVEPVVTGAPATEDRTGQQGDRTEPATAPTGLAVASDALAAACHVVVHRALEKAGARLRSAAGKNVQGGAAAIACPDPTRLHVDLDATAYADLSSLLDGAWALIPEIAERCNVNADALIDTLDAYARGLLAAQNEHSYGRLAAALGHTAAV